VIHLLEHCRFHLHPPEKPKLRDFLLQIIMPENSLRTQDTAQNDHSDGDPINDTPSECRFMPCRSFQLTEMQTIIPMVGIAAVFSQPFLYENLPKDFARNDRATAPQKCRYR
jgi:hypothetical protein